MSRTSPVWAIRSRGRFKTKVTYPRRKRRRRPATHRHRLPPTSPSRAPRCNSRRSGRSSPTRISRRASKRRAWSSRPSTRTPHPGSSCWSASVPPLLLIGAFVWISRRAAAAAGGGLFGLGRSRAKRYSEEQPKVTFDDVAGIDEAENELIEIVDFLKNPAKYQRLGGTVPKGVLLVGAPGTGKTLLARAIAGQAGVPFFSLSASEFVEMIVGVGASRVRDLFKQAREAAPAIIFIDELDAIGRTRGSGAQLGGHDEREQTLNQILTEMDGFDSREGVIVLAATNRADVLDQALAATGPLRPPRRRAASRPRRPRRDSQGAHQERPAGAGRLARAHRRRDAGPGRRRAAQPGQRGGAAGGAQGRELRSVPRISRRRCRRSPSARRATFCSTRRIGSAPPTTRRGTRCSRCWCPAATRCTASRSCRAAWRWERPISSPSTIAPTTPRTTCGRASPARSAAARPRSSSMASATTGAENDLQQVTEIARHMVLRWGMSEKLGPISFVAPQDEGLPPAFQHQPYSEATSELIDAEVRRIVEESHREADRLLAEHRDKLDALAQALLKAESLNAKEIREVTGLTEPPSQEEDTSSTRTGEQLIRGTPPASQPIPTKPGGRQPACRHASHVANTVWRPATLPTRPQVSCRTASSSGCACPTSVGMDLPQLAHVVRKVGLPSARNALPLAATDSTSCP